MKKGITIKLTNAELELIHKVLSTVNDVMTYRNESDKWVADYESFILSLNDDEFSNLSRILGEI